MDSAVIDVPKTEAVSKGAAPLVVAPRPLAMYKKWMAIVDLILRVCALVTAVAAASTMATSDMSLPFFTQFFQFQAGYDDLPTFQFFLVAMSLVAGYLLLSLPLSILCIMRPHAPGPRMVLFILDIVALVLATSAGAAAAAVVYLLHHGSPNTNWIAICRQFGDFCQKVSGAVVASFFSMAPLMLLVILSAIALRGI